MSVSPSQYAIPDGPNDITPRDPERKDSAEQTEEVADVTVQPQTDATQTNEPREKQCHFGYLPNCKVNVNSRNAIRRATKTRYPPTMLRLATVSMSTKSPCASNVNYVKHPRHERTVIGWQEAYNSRPPLKIDMDGPTPCSYSPRNKPLYETNTPKWSFGRRTFVEKEGGSRTSWVKTWYQSQEIWKQKADFFSDLKWPAPDRYEMSSAMGPVQFTNKRYPAYTIGERREEGTYRRDSQNEPSPNDYDCHRSVSLLCRRSPAFSMGTRQQGTKLWRASDDDYPGPGTYTPDLYGVNTTCRPSYTMRGIRRSKSHMYGPFATL